MRSLSPAVIVATLSLLMLSCGGGSTQNPIVQPNFTLSASPASLNVQQGNQGTTTITTTIGGGFNSAITLSTSGVPTGTTVSFNPNLIPAPGSGSSTMTITVGSSTPVGTYPITVTGNGGGIQQNTTVTLTVTIAPNFTISASPASLNVAQGNQGTSTLTTTVSGGFNSAITLSASGVPSGTTVSFNPNPIPAPGSGSSTMTITVGSSTPTGTYPITVTGNGGGIQQNVSVSLTVTSSGGGGGGGNGIVVYSTSGSPQTNRFVSIGRFFKRGDIPHFAQAVVGGTAILTQCDVKNLWPDGSLKFGIISFIVPSVATSGTQVTFQDQGTGNNTGYLTQAQMLSGTYNFGGQMQLVGSGASPTIDANTMLSNGSFTYWLQGPIVTAIILEDRATRTYDVNTDGRGSCPVTGGSNCPLHPIIEAWFYPATSGQSASVEIGYTLENSWASHAAAYDARDQTFSLTLTAGQSKPSTCLTQSSFTQYGFTRWRRPCYISQLPAISVDYGWSYLSTTGAYPNYDPTYPPLNAALTAAENGMIAAYTRDKASYPALFTIPGGTDSSGNLATGEIEADPNAGGSAPWIGLNLQWDAQLLASGNYTLFQMMSDNANLSGRFPIFFREADENAGTGQHFDCTVVTNGNCTSGTIATQGLPVSINARQSICLSLTNFSACNTGSESIAYSVPTDGSTWWSFGASSEADSTHFPDLDYVAYTLTGKYFYYEQEMLEAAWMVGWSQGPYNASATYGRQGHYGLIYTVTRARAWGIRTAAYAAFIGVDGQPEAPYFLEKVQNNYALWEGEHNITLDVSNIDTSWVWGWASTLDQYSQASNVSPLHLWDDGNCADGTYTCYVANGDGAANNINASVALAASSSFMLHYLNDVLGMMDQLGVVNTTAMLTSNAHLPIHVALDPNVNPFLQDQYTFPTIMLGGGCTGNLPLASNCTWFPIWTTWEAGYLSQPSTYSFSARGADYGAQALGELSFMTGISVDGFSGLTAYDTYKAANTYLPMLCTTEPFWCILPASTTQ